MAPFTNKHTQADHVVEDQGVKEEFIKVRKRLPGLKTLHNRPIAEIAAAITNVLKSERNVVEFRYVLGEYIELTIQNID